MWQKISLAKIVEYGVYLLIFLLPWQTRLIYKVASLNGGYWEYGSNSFYASEAFLIVLVILFLVWRKKSGGQKVQRKDVVLPLVFLVWSLVSVVWSLDRNLAIYYWSFFAQGFLLYFLISYGPVDRTKAVVSFVMAAGVQAALAWYQFLTQSIFASKWLGMASQSANDLGVFVIESGGQRWLRAYGSLPHPNILAAFLVVALIFLFFLSLNVNSSRQKLFIVSGLSLILPALIFTFSRAAWLSLIVCFLSFITLLIIKRIKNKFTAEILVLSVILVIIIGAIFWSPIKPRLVGGERLETLSNQQRVGLYKQSDILLQKYAYYGVGPGNQTLAVYKEIDNKQPSWFYQPVHNIYVLVLIEIGVVGVAIYTVLIISFLFFSQGDLSGKLAFLSLLIVGLFDHFLWSLYFGIILWWLVASLSKKNDYVRN
ncbi:MAG: O-antigen ligase family protein [Patescibacteria group bacterium]|jgi:putative inorganic carbon (HCO3(-)) transporter